MSKGHPVWLFSYIQKQTNERWWCMARAPDARMEQARELFLEGKKLIEISELLKIPEGTIRSWKNRYDWDNATLQKKRNVAKRKGGQPGNKMLLEPALRRTIRMRSPRESSKLSFLIAWIQRSSAWRRLCRRTSRNFSCRRFSF